MQGPVRLARHACLYCVCLGCMLDLGLEEQFVFPYGAHVQVLGAERGSCKPELCHVKSQRKAPRSR